MLTLTLSEIRDNDKNVIGFLCDQRDENFAKLVAIGNDVIPREAAETKSSLQYQVDFFKALIPMCEAEPIYSTHEYLRAGSVETWTVYKISILNSHIHYCGLRLKTFK